MIVSKLLKIMLWKLILIRMVQFMLEYSRRGENGHGKLTWSDGRRYLRGWENGEMWNGKVYDKNQNIIAKVVNGKRIKQ